MSGDLIEPQFHVGERKAQALAGVAPRGSAIRHLMPDQHRVFFAALPFVVVATVDDAGWPLATILSGPPGFVASPDPETLWIAAAPDNDDPAAPWIKPGAPFGLLGIDLATRRRNRANGWIANAAPGRLTVAVKESFGNCAQYIHIRAIGRRAGAAGATERVAGLDARACAAIGAADTFFVATSGGERGVDISHRAGKPGFVRIDGDTLTIPDYPGNRYFNTLGNLLLDPRAGLLFPDFDSGDLLLVQGRAEIVWDPPEGQRLPGADRLWRLKAARTWHRRGALPYRWSLQAMSTSAALAAVR
ncbi:MAG TPA: pyridoxamine 5'-phosphate oxidase family protein [Stellaceae bacterium]|nr:pyridoxamine 5'-phosphate oxidase family protein [Stellaceae bacterium]